MIVHAQKIENPLLEESIRGMEGATFFSRLFPFIINWLFIFVILAFGAYFIKGVFMMMGAGDKPDVFKRAQQQLTNVVVGIIIAFSMFAAIKLVGRLFGLEGLENLRLTLPEL